MINKDNLLDSIVAKIQKATDTGTDNYCYDELIQSSFNFQNPSIDFSANGIYLIQS